MTVILVIIFLIFGAFLSYLWVLGNFYYQPENTTFLTITEANFPTAHADYFNFTIINPSNSISSTNITRIYLTAGNSTTIFDVNQTSPGPLPITVERGTSQTVKCFRNWGELAGQNITLNVVGTQTSGSTKTVETKFVKLDMRADFDPTVSSKKFILTLENDPTSAINLTLTKILVHHQTLGGQNISISLPYNLTIGNTATINCKYDWESLVNPLVSVETLEGYNVEETFNATAAVFLTVEDVKFSETNSTEIAITVSNSELSETLVDINGITLTYSNGTKFPLNGNLTNPPFYPFYRLDVNHTVTFNHCMWNWTHYRGQNLTVSVFTKQNYTAATKVIQSTPGPIIFNIKPLFNLTNTQYFFVNITNEPISLQEINVAQIKLNATRGNFTSQTVPIGASIQFNVTFDWTTYKGKGATITVNASKVIAQETLTLPSVLLKVTNSTFQNGAAGKTFSVNIESVPESLNSTVSHIVISFGNQTIFQAEGIGLVIQGGANATLTFSWNWTSYNTKEVTISVYTTQNLQFNATVTIP